MATAMRVPGRGNRAFIAAAALVLGVAAGRFLGYEPAVGDAPADLTELQAQAAADVRRAIETGDPSFAARAGATLDAAADLAPGDGDTALVRGQLALTLHEFEEALDHGRGAVAAGPHSAEARLLEVDALVELGRYDEAAAALQQALDIRPGLAALSRASYQRELRGDLAGALLAMQQAQIAGAGSAFDRATVTTLVGDLHLRTGDVGAAAAAYRDALRASPGMVAARTGQARALAASGRRGDAISLLEEVVAAFPAAGPAQLLGDLRAAAGDGAGASAAYDLVRAAARLQEAAGGIVDLEMAVFEADHGDPVAARRLAERAHATRPTVYAADAVGWARYRGGDAIAAVPFARDALRLGTADPMLRVHAAAIFAGAGDRAGAQAELRRAFEGTPWFLPPGDDLVPTLAADLGVPMPEAWAAWAS